MSVAIKKAFLMIFALSILALLPDSICAQQKDAGTDGLSISIMVSSRYMVQKKPFLVGITLENRSGQAIPWGGMTLELEKAGQTTWAQGDRYSTGLSFSVSSGLSRKKFILPGEKIAFRVDLKKSYWLEGMTSITLPLLLDRSLPKADYQLYAGYRYDESDAKESKRREIKSNHVKISYK
jgi:hypothetical protein